METILFYARNLHSFQQLSGHDCQPQQGDSPIPGLTAGRLSLPGTAAGAGCKQSGRLSFIHMASRGLRETVPLATYNSPTLHKATCDCSPGRALLLTVTPPRRRVTSTWLYICSAPRHHQVQEIELSLAHSRQMQSCTTERHTWTKYLTL